jgi:hypothetical protein
MHGEFQHTSEQSSRMATDMKADLDMIRKNTKEAQAMVQDLLKSAEVRCNFLGISSGIVVCISERNNID